METRTVKRDTLLLEEGARVWILGDWHKGTVKRHNARTGRYMIEVDDFPGQRLHQKYIYRNRSELWRVGTSR